MSSTSVTGVILAGGESSRLGRDKALERVAGQTMIGRVIRAISPVCADIVIVANAGNRKTLVEAGLGYTVIEDLVPGAKVLGGIYTGLMHSGAPCILAVGCDMPFVNTLLLEQMIDAFNKNCSDVVVPVLGGRMQVLHALYSRRCLPQIMALLDAGSYTVVRFFDCVNTHHLREEEIDRFDKSRLSFFNVNTRADLEEAGRLAALKR